MKQTWSKLRAQVVYVYIEYVCFMFASSREQGITVRVMRLPAVLRLSVELNYIYINCTSCKITFNAYSVIRTKNFYVHHCTWATPFAFTSVNANQWRKSCFGGCQYSSARMYPKSYERISLCRMVRSEDQKRFDNITDRSKVSLLVHQTLT